MAPLSTSRLLSRALTAFGIVFLALPVLNRIWPSGWAWQPEQMTYLHMIWSIYATLGVFLLLAARDPARHLSLIWFTVWSSLAHGTVMAIHTDSSPQSGGDADLNRRNKEDLLYEHRTHQVLSAHRFALRLLVNLLASSLIIALSLVVGIWGYEHFERLRLREAFLNSAMLLGGMGPVKTDLSPGGEVFAGFYALYSGLVFIVTAGVLLAPIVHRLLHTVHCDLEDRPGS